jgi:hypothetical protein
MKIGKGWKKEVNISRCERCEKQKKCFQMEALSISYRS